MSFQLWFLMYLFQCYWKKEYWKWDDGFRRIFCVCQKKICKWNLYVRIWSKNALQITQTLVWHWHSPLLEWKIVTKAYEPRIPQTDRDLLGAPFPNLATRTTVTMDFSMWCLTTSNCLATGLLQADTPSLTFIWKVIIKPRESHGGYWKKNTFVST